MKLLLKWHYYDWRFCNSDLRKAIAKDLGCLLSQQDIGDPTLRLKLGSKRNRKKRDASRRNKGRGKIENTTNSNSTNVPTVYGCPANYERITDSKIDICLRFGKLANTEKDVVAKYNEAKKHCWQDNAKLLYFLDSNEALKIWKWIGKYIRKYLEYWL